MMVYCWCI